MELTCYPVMITIQLTRSLYNNLPAGRQRSADLLKYYSVGLHGTMNVTGPPLKTNVDIMLTLV
jgi:hypothetical protein